MIFWTPRSTNNEMVISATNNESSIFGHSHWSRAKAAQEPNVDPSRRGTARRPVSANFSGRRTAWWFFAAKNDWKSSGTIGTIVKQGNVSSLEDFWAVATPEKQEVIRPDFVPKSGKRGRNYRNLITSQPETPAAWKLPGCPIKKACFWIDYNNSLCSNLKSPAVFGWPGHPYIFSVYPYYIYIYIPLAIMYLPLYTYMCVYYIYIIPHHIPPFLLAKSHYIPDLWQTEPLVLPAESTTTL